jgi:hypothetical protein
VREVAYVETVASQSAVTRRATPEPLEVVHAFPRLPRALRHLEVRTAPRAAPLHVPDRLDARRVGPPVHPRCPLPCAPYHGCTFVILRHEHVHRL